MGTRIPAPPYSTPSIEDLVRREAQMRDNDAKKGEQKSRAPSKKSKKRATAPELAPRVLAVPERGLPLPLLAAASASVVVALWSRSRVVRMLALAAGGAAVAIYVKGYRFEDVAKLFEQARGAAMQGLQGVEPGSNKPGSNKVPIRG